MDPIGFGINLRGSKRRLLFGSWGCIEHWVKESEKFLEHDRLQKKGRVSCRCCINDSPIWLQVKYVFTMFITLICRYTSLLLVYIKITHLHPPLRELTQVWSVWQSLPRSHRFVQETLHKLTQDRLLQREWRWLKNIIIECIIYLKLWKKPFYTLFWCVFSVVKQCETLIQCTDTLGIYATIIRWLTPRVQESQVLQDCLSTPIPWTNF